MRNISLLSLLTIVLFSFSSCEDEEVATATESYLRILDDQDYNASFNPISIQETNTGGSIILSGIDAENTDLEGINIIRLDSLGAYQSEFELIGYVTPIGELMKVDSAFYFFCMEEGTEFVNLATVDASGAVTTVVRVSGGLRFPLAASLNSDNNFVLLSYDGINQRSVISIVEPDGTLFTSAGYSIGAGADREPDIWEHLVNPSINYPFFVGQDAGGYYFNGFYNHTLSLVFTSFGSDPNGVMQGQQTIAGLRAIEHISGSEYAVLGFQYDQNYVQPVTTLATSGISSSVGFFNRSIPEIRPNAPAKIITLERPSGEQIIVIATETESRQGILYFYDIAGGLLGTHYVGYLNPFTLADVVSTADGGILVTGTTFVASRFERIYVSKIPSLTIDELIN